MGFISGYWKSWLISLQDLYQLFFSGLGKLKMFWLSRSWDLSKFSRKTRKKTLEVTGLPASIQCVAKFWFSTIIIMGVTETCLKVDSVNGHRQHAFTSRKFCLMYLVSFYDKVTHLDDWGKALDVVCLDFSNAVFLRHPSGWYVLHIIRQKKNCCGWIIGWWVGLRVLCGVNGVTLGWWSITSGVPQGSILEPDTFRVFINGMDSGLKCILSQFGKGSRVLSVWQQVECESIMCPDGQKGRLYSGVHHAQH